MLIARAPAVGSAPIGADDRFFDELPALRDFGGVADDARYAPLPDDWVLAVADVAGSTVAIADGRYRLLKRVPPGTYKITASRQSAENPFSKLLDMKDTEQTLTIVPGQERAEMNFNLQRH